MHYLLLFCLLRISFFVTGSGTSYIPIPETPWLNSDSITVISDTDTLSATLSSEGSTVGLLIFPQPDAGESLLVIADTLAISVSSIAKLNLQPFALDSVFELPSFYTGLDMVPEGLFISGTKRLGVSVGSGGGISQGTELAIEGFLVPGISINGKITDRDLPLGASASEALSELDKVYIALDGGVWNAEMGDLDWESLASVPWRTEVSGFSGGFDVGSLTHFAGGYGTTGSERHKIVVITEEGLQGPYTFEQAGGVTPGSERVQLDGIVMHRGAGADYEIDYAAGQITFTTKRLIRRDQRVDISWYRMGDGFRKDVSKYSTEIFPFTNLSILFSGYSNQDNTDVPLGFVMTDEIAEALGNAGDNPAEAWIDGGIYVGENKGDYILDSLLHYQWVGFESGDWAVEFQSPPEGLGDYIYDSSIGGYLWVGAEQGTHFARKYINIPTSINLFSSTISGETDFFDSYSVYSNFSKYEGNLFNANSTTREGTFSGGQFTASLWNSGPIWNVEGRYISDGFNAPDELDSDFDLQKWGLPATWKGADNFIFSDIGGEALLFSAGQRFLEGGGKTSISDLSYSPFSGNFKTLISLNGLIRDGALALSEGKLGTVLADLSIGIREFTPFVNCRFTSESWADSLSGNLIESNIGVVFSKANWTVTTSGGGEIDNRDGISHPEKTLRLNLVSDGNGANWNTNASILHSTGLFEGGGSTSSNAVKAGYSVRAGGLWFYSQYSAGGYFSKLMEIVYQWVGDGYGDYSYDPETGEYYSDPSGDYRQTYIPGQGETRTLETSLNGGFSWADSASTVGIDGSFLLDASDPENRFKTYTLAGAFDINSPGGWRASLSPYLTWESTLSRFTVKLSGFDMIENYSGVGNTRETYTKLELIPFFEFADFLTVELSGKTAFRRRALYGNRESDEIAVDVNPIILVNSFFDIGTKFSVERRIEREGGLDVINWGISPNFAFNGRGWTASGSFSSYYMPGDILVPVPTWFFEGRQIGWTLEPRLNIGRRVNQWFFINMFYRGRKISEQDWTQQGGLEGTVNF